MKLLADQDVRKIIFLYKNEEKSAQEISDALEVSLKKVYKTLHENGIERRDARLQNKIRFNKKPLSFNFPDILSSSNKELTIAAVMLYLGEGAKTGTTVDFVNSNGGALKIFLRFLCEICRVDENKLRFYLYCFSDQNAEELKRYWADELKVDIDAFTKPYVRKSASKSGRIMEKGVLHIRYNDKRLLEKILSLCSAMVAELLA